MKAWLLLADHQNQQRTGFIAESIPSNPRSACRPGKVGRTQSSSKGRKLHSPQWESGSHLQPPSDQTNQQLQRPGRCCSFLFKQLVLQRDVKKHFQRFPLESGFCKKKAVGSAGEVAWPYYVAAALSASFRSSITRPTGSQDTVWEVGCAAGEAQANRAPELVTFTCTSDSWDTCSAAPALPHFTACYFKVNTQNLSLKEAG